MPESSARRRKRYLKTAGIVLLVLGILFVSCGLMGLSQTGYYSRKLKITAGEWVSLSTGKTVLEPLNESDYKGKNLNESGRFKTNAADYLNKITTFDKITMPLRYVLIVLGAAMALAGAFILIKYDIWSIVTVVATIFYLVFLIYPLFKLLRQSFIATDGSFTKEFFQAIFTKKYYKEAIIHSLLISTAVTIMAVLIATPMAYIMSTIKIKFAGTLRILILVSSMSAPFIGAYSWIMLLGRNGTITNFLASIGIRIGDIYGFTGCVLVMGFQLYSLVFMYLSGAFSKMDQSLLEASESFCCTGLRKLFRVVLPLMMPTLLAGALLVFMRAFADYGTPMLIGENYLTLPVMVYKEFLSETGGSDGLAAAISIVAIIITTAVFLIQKYIVNRKSFSISALHPVEPVQAKGAKNVFAHLYCYVMVGIALMPQCYVIYSSFRKTSGKLYVEGFWLKSYADAFNQVGHSIWMTYVLSFISIFLIVTVACLISYLVVRRRNVFNASLDIMSMFPETVAGSILGIALLSSFNKRPLLLSGGMLIMILSYVIRRLPYTVRSSSAILRSISPSIEEAAVSLGASPSRIFFRITTPMMMSGVVSGAILSWIMIITELSTSILLYTPVTKTMTLEIYTQITRGNYGLASAISSILTYSTIIALALFFKLTGKKEISM